MNGLPVFPATFEQALDKVAAKRRLQLRRYEYWGVPIRTLRWIDDGFLKDVQFDYRDADIGVTLQKGKTGGLFIFLRWCHNNIPMFPNLLQLQTSARAALAKDQSLADYIQKVESFIEHHV
jgi:hypothetical protein